MPAHRNAMNAHTWVLRLIGQLPGWHIWYTSGGGMPRGWYAVPAAADTDHVAALALPGRIFAETPAGLRTFARERYGWDDTCETCGVLARECGHRQPEREGSR